MSKTFAFTTRHRGAAAKLRVACIAVPTFTFTGLLATQSVHAQVIAQDAANNYSGWSNTNSPDNGSGFGSWSFAYGGASNGAYENTSSVAISTGGDAFGLYANGGNSNNPYIGATRAFNTNLASGDAFHITLQNNGVDSGGGSEGFHLTSSSGQALDINFTGGQTYYYIFDGAGSGSNTTSNIPYASGGAQFNVVLTSSSTYNLYATVSGTTYAYIGRTLQSSSAISSVTVDDVKNTAGGDFYFNSLAEVGTITNSSSGNWSTASGWTSSFLPANGDNVAFSSSSGGTTTNNLLNAVNSITFNSGAGSYTLANSTSAVLYVGQTPDGAGGFYSIRNSSSSAQTLSGNIGLLSSSAVIDSGSSTITISGVLSGGANVNGASSQTSSLVKVGSGTLILSNTSNTYTGTSSGSLNANGTQIQAGTLGIYADTSLGLAPAGAYNNIQFTGNGTLQDTSSNISLNANRNISITSGITGTLDNGGNTFTVPGIINGSGALGLKGSGTTVLSGVNTYSGETDINAGTVIAANSSALSGTETYLGNGGTTGTAASLFLGSAGGISTSQAIGINAGNGSDRSIGSLNTSGTDTFSGTVSMNGSSGDNRSINISVPSGGTLAFTNIIDGSTAATSNVTVAGPGTVIFGHTNYYYGNTTITGGTLQSNGARVLSGSTLVSSGTGTGAVTVNSGATLAGTGGTGNVTVNGTITAGTGQTTSDSIGTLATGSQTWNSGGTYVAKVNLSSVTPSTTGGSGSSDKLVMSGLSSVGSSFAISALGLNTASFSGGQTYSWIIADNTSSSTAFNTFLSSLNSHLTTTNFSAGTASLSTMSDGGSGEDLLLDYTAAPEPTSFLLLGAAVLPMVLERRRRKPQAE